MRKIFYISMISALMLFGSVAYANFTDIVTIKLETITENQFDNRNCIVKGYITEIEFTNSLDQIGSGLELNAKCEDIQSLESGNEVKVYKDKDTIYEFDLLSADSIDINQANSEDNKGLRAIILVFLVASASALSFVFIK